MGCARGSLLIGALQVAVVGGYSPALAETLKYPVLELARNVTFGLFLERIEAIHLGVWIIGTFVKVGIFSMLLP